MASDRQIHLGQKLDPATLDALADFVCGNEPERFPTYRSSSFLTRFFQDCGVNAAHDGSTRKWWALDVLKQLQPSELEKVILRLTDLREYKGDRKQLKLAMRSMNDILAMDDIGIGIEGTKSILVRATPVVLDENDLLKAVPAASESEFLSKQFGDDITISELGLDTLITPVLQDRIDEARACPQNKVPLGTLFLLGSTLEGVLLAVALKDPAKFMSSKSAPKDKADHVLQLHAWTLSNLIDVAHDVQLLDIDVKKFSHVLRDFRNYIHPYAQMAQGFRPNQDTVNICWQVFKAAFKQLKRNSK